MKYGWPQGQGQGAEALSGIARAFFYADASALLASHWVVGSDAAVRLTTRAFQELKAHPEIGRAEAMRISMHELIKTGTPVEAHPSMWAPFVVVVRERQGERAFPLFDREEHARGTLPSGRRFIVVVESGTATVSVP
jgi:CHAT domain